MEARPAASPAENNLTFTIFLAAMSLHEAERESYLREACQGRPGRLTEVQRRVAWETRLNGFLLTPAVCRERMDRPFAPGDRVLQRFRIVRVAGEGGMGVVYEASDEKVAHRIALKVPRFEFRKRLSPEVLKSLRVTHANVCRVFELHTEETNVGEVDFLTMEFLDGATLAVRLEQVPACWLETTEGRAIAEQLCQGLAAIHAEGIVHHDLKPTNVMLTNGARRRAVIMDFGIARDADIFSSQVRGTPAYLAPELWKGLPATAQSDLYALGVILYEMAAGRRPFRENAPWQERLRAAAPAPPVREPLRSAIQRCLDPNPARRFQSAAELAYALHTPTRHWYSFPAATVTTCLIAALLVNARVVPLALSAIHRQLPVQITVAVLPFRSADRSTESKMLCDRLPAAIANGLVAKQPLHGTLRIAPAGDPRVNLTITGLLRRQEGGFRLDLGLLDARSGHRIASPSLAAPGNSAYLLQDEAVQQIATLLNLDQTPPPADSAYSLYSRARASLDRYDRKGNIDAAIGLLQQVIHQDPGYAVAYASLSEAYWRRYREARNLTDREEALQMGLRATRIDSRVSSGHIALGRVFATSGDRQRAAAEYQEALHLDPAALAAGQELAEVLASQGRTAEAEATYRRAIDLRPDDWTLLTSMGIFYWVHGRYREAAASFSRVVALQPDNPIAHRNLADNLFALGEYGQAASEAERALELRPGFPVWVLLANIELAKGNYKAAVRLGRLALANEGAASNAHVLTSLADACRFDPESAALAPDLYRQAIRILDRAIAVNTKDGVAYAMRALDRAKTGDMRGATRDAAEALRFAPRDVEVLVNWAEVQELAGRRAKALIAISRARKAGYPLVRIRDNPDFHNLRQDSRYLKNIAH